VVRRLIYPLPFLGLVTIVATRRWARDNLVVIALVAYVAYLTPYMIVAYYRRYAIPLLGLQVMFETWGLDSLWQLLPHRVSDNSP
jgi:hypothetical protein